MKLLNTDYNVRLHSHEVQYGSGSGQQSVTAIEDVSEAGSYWKVMGPNGVKLCNRGQPIKCGSTIRLNHIVTGKNLHSHHFQSPLSKNYEVSAFGADGVGDEGDDWKLHCDSSFWKRNEPFKLQHVSTASYLHVSGRTFGHPISGQYEPKAFMYSLLSPKTTLHQCTMMNFNRILTAADVPQRLTSFGRSAATTPHLFPAFCFGGIVSWSLPFYLMSTEVHLEEVINRFFTNSPFCLDGWTL
ncbi:Stromal cell-derived factor 2-like protein [Sparganum proliferum]